MPTRLIQRHDEFAKHILDEPGHADAFIRERLPAEVVRRLSGKPAVDRSESHISRELQNLRGDRVYAVETVDGDEVLIWTMVEHKAWPEPDTLLQLLGDLTAIARKGARKRENADGTVWMVPAPVYGIVLYHGERRWPLPTSLAEAYGLPEDLVALGLLTFTYRLADLIRIPDDELSGDPSLRAALMVLKYALYDGAPLVTLDRLIEAAAGFGLTTLIVVVRYLVKRSDWIEEADIRARVARLMPEQEEAIMSPFMRQIIEEARPKIAEEIRPKIAEEIRPGIIAEVRPGFVNQGRVETLLRLLGRKFGPLSDDTVQRVRMADTHQLEQLADNLLDSETLEDVFAGSQTQ